MLHFPSSLKNAGPNTLPKRSDSLNATQKTSATHEIFAKIEEELHDARRVHSHGQEEDLRLALNMVINRVSELSTLLSEAYKSQADLEVQLNVAKSNLQLVISNNEMLEEALKRDTSGHAKDVGWRRAGGRESEQRDRRSSEESSNPASGEHTPSPETGTNSPMSAAHESRFFKFRFTSSSSPNPGTRPGTPLDARSPGLNGSHHLNSPSLPILPSQASKEVEELTAQLQKEREARKAAADEKAALEAELESLSQALFEEANKMVATERIKRAETEEELKEARSEREALRSALRLLEGENVSLRGSSQDTSPVVPFVSFKSHSRSSSEVGIKSAPTSPTSSRPPTPSTAGIRRKFTPSPLKEPGTDRSGRPEDDTEDSQITPQVGRPLHLEELSPWADVRSRSPALTPLPSTDSALFKAPTT